MPTAEAAFLAKIREQIKFLRDHQYAYNQLLVYVPGIAEPWVFGRADEFDFDGDQVLVVRMGPTREHGNGEVPEAVLPSAQRGQRHRQRAPSAGSGSRETGTADGVPGLPEAVLSCSLRSSDWLQGVRGRLNAIQLSDTTSSALPTPPLPLHPAARPDIATPLGMPPRPRCAATPRRSFLRG
jgi:hypothetical protein